MCCSLETLSALPHKPSPYNVPIYKKDTSSLPRVTELTVLVAVCERDSIRSSILEMVLDSIIRTQVKKSVLLLGLWFGFERSSLLAMLPAYVSRADKDHWPKFNFYRFGGTNSQ